ncbi:uncharacterized protein [Mytilus edulis]|uniref:uncharacterized protein isoform X1 n=1 Tax=Mytilus edulis TaxID=6550 RepID=UPI0039EF1B7C
MTLRRLNREFLDITNNPPPGCCSAALVNDDLYTWECKITGPDKSSYAGGVFVVLIRFPRDYPFKPPTVNFTTKIFHLNINGNSGSPCTCCTTLLSNLSNWSPTQRVSGILLSISSVLNSTNSDCQLNEEAAMLYTKDRMKYYATAAEWTRKYAM